MYRKWGNQGGSVLSLGQQTPSKTLHPENKQAHKVKSSIEFILKK